MAFLQEAATRERVGKPADQFSECFVDPDEPVSFVAPEGATVNADDIALLGRIQEFARTSGKSFVEAAEAIERGW